MSSCSGESLPCCPRDADPREGRAGTLLGEMEQQGMLWLSPNSSGDKSCSASPSRLSLPFPGQWEMKFPPL